MTRRIILFGGSGQVGQDIRALTLPDGFVLDAPTRAEADITDAAAVAARLSGGDVSAVINTAGWTAVDAAEDSVADAFAANALGPAVLADATRRSGVPLIHVSTDYVFDGAKPTAYDETDRTAPLGVYGASKLAGEEAVRTGNPEHVIVRTAWVFGRHGGNFVKTMLRVAGEQDTVRVVDDQRGTPTAAADLAAALVAIAVHSDLRARSGTYHFANRGETTWCGFARRIFAISAASGGVTAAVEPIATEDYPTPARRPANSCLATGKVELAFGITPRSWEDALADMMA